MTRTKETKTNCYLAQTVKNPATMQETQIQFLGWEDPVEKEMAIHSNILAWRIPWTEGPGRLQSRGYRSGTRLNHDHHCRTGLLWWLRGKESACNAGDPSLIPGSGRSPGEGNGYPLQYSCLENPMDRGAWRATVHGVAKS